MDIIKQLSNEYDTRLTIVREYAKGENTNRTAGDVSPFGEMRLSSKKISTAIHEFAHSLTSTHLKKFGLETNEDFWKEIKKIRNEYNKARRIDRSILISFYAETDIDEFMAEAFTQAKMAELGLEFTEEYGSDLTYSRKVLEIIDKYFKKKKK